MKTKRAFTLVELLVVIGILSVLAALLLPSLQNAVELGYKASCMNNNKQYYLLTQVYSADYQCVFPFAVTKNPYDQYEPGNFTQTGHKLMYEAQLLDRAHIVNMTTPVSFVNNNIRSSNPSMCPAGRLFGFVGWGGGQTETVNATYQQSPDNPIYGAFSEYWEDRRDRVSEQYNDNNMPPWLNPYTRFSYSPLSYGFNATDGTLYQGIKKQPNGVLYKTLRSSRKAESKTLLFMEMRDPNHTYYYKGSFNSGLKVDQLKPVSTNSSLARKFRMPHLGSNVYTCMDGHTSSIDRYYFMGTTTSEADLPFQF